MGVHGDGQSMGVGYAPGHMPYAPPWGISSAMERLRRRETEACRLRAEGLTWEEIGERLGVRADVARRDWERRHDFDLGRRGPGGRE